MKCFYDLHIHSCLSPCSDDDMTPNNIVNMSVLKGLHLIAVSDHNAVDHVRTVMALGAEAGLVVVPAMELCTSEEIHLLCLFPTAEAAETVAAKLYEGVAVPTNRPDIFGHQWVLDAADQPVREEPNMLLAASGLDVDAALTAVRAVGGVVVPAHVDRDAYSMEATLGMVPPEYGLRVVEASKGAFPLLTPLDGMSHLLLNSPVDAAQAPGNGHETLPCLVNSDAHHLWDISEPEHAVALSECTIPALLETLRLGKGLPQGYRKGSL